MYEPYNADPAERLPLPQNMIIRGATMNDAFGIAQLRAERAGKPVQEFVAGMEDEIRKLEVASRRLLVAVVDGEVVAFARAGLFTHPTPPPPKVAPEGWYLLGVIVADAWRRRGIARVLGQALAKDLVTITPRVYSFCNATNQTSIALHGKLGFQEVTRDFVYPNVEFTGGMGILFCAPLS